MRRRFLFKPSRAASALGVVGGLAILYLGLTQVDFGTSPFVLVWAGILVLTVLYHLANLLKLPIPGLFSAEADAPADEAPPDFAAALRDLEALRGDGLISEEEYARKRAEILRRRW